MNQDLLIDRQTDATVSSIYPHLYTLVDHIQGELDRASFQ